MSTDKPDTITVDRDTFRVLVGAASHLLTVGQLTIDEWTATTCAVQCAEEAYRAQVGDDDE